MNNSITMMVVLTVTLSAAAKSVNRKILLIVIQLVYITLVYSKVYFTVLCMDILHYCVATGSVEFCSMSWGAGNRVHHLPRDMEAHYCTAQCTLQGNVEPCTVMYSAAIL